VAEILVSRFILTAEFYKVPIEMLIVGNFTKNFPAFNWTRNFSYHVHNSPLPDLSWSKWIHSTQKLLL